MEAWREDLKQLLAGPPDSDLLDRIVREADPWQLHRALQEHSERELKAKLDEASRLTAQRLENLRARDAMRKIDDELAWPRLTPPLPLIPPRFFRGDVRYDRLPVTKPFREHMEHDV